MGVKSVPADRGRLTPAALIALAGIAVYLNSFGGPFIFDDPEAISENPSIRRLWDITAVLSPPAHGQAVQRRPVANLSLAINYAIGGLDVRGYHVFNLAVHILSAISLFGVVRRSIEGERNNDAGIRKSSTMLAAVVGMIWVVHPLNTDAVSYIVQRTELLAGLFYLLSLYCVIRGSESENKWWYAGAVLSCAAGMGSKEVVVSCPVVVLVYDRIFLSGSFKEALRRRWGLYLGLAGTWGITAILIPQGSEGAAIFGQRTASVCYALGQFEVITNYVRLCFWPSPLILDYGLYEPTTLVQALPYAAVVGVLVLVTGLALYYWPRPGFLGVWFFAILAPSSSFVPVLAQGSAEKRMYLPLAAVVTITVLCVWKLGRIIMGGWANNRGQRVIAYALAGTVIVVLGGLTLRRNYDYRSELAIWQDTVEKRPNNTRAYNNRGLVYWRMGEYEQAIGDFSLAAKLKPDYAKTYNNRGLAYWSMGKRRRATADFNEAIRLDGRFARAYYNRAEIYREKGDNRRAIGDLDRAIELGLENARVYNSRGLAHLRRNDREQAVLDFRRAVKLRPDFAEAQDNLRRAEGQI